MANCCRQNSEIDFNACNTTGDESRQHCCPPFSNHYGSSLHQLHELHQVNPTNIYSAYDSNDWKHVTCGCYHENDARAHVWRHTPQSSMSKGHLILNTFGTRPRSQFAASSCRTRLTLLVRLTDVVVNRNLTQTASTLNRLRSTVPQPLKLYGLRSYESYTNPVHLYPLRGDVTELLLVNSLFTSLPSASTYAKVLLKSYKKIYIHRKNFIRKHQTIIIFWWFSQA